MSIDVSSLAINSVKDITVFRLISVFFERIKIDLLSDRVVTLSQFQMCEFHPQCRILSIVRRFEYGGPELFAFSRIVLIGRIRDDPTYSTFHHTDRRIVSLAISSPAQNIFVRFSICLVLCNAF